MQGKKRIVTSYGQLDAELKLEIKKDLPGGFKKNLITIPKADGSSYKAFTWNKGDTVYLIKVEEQYLKSADELLAETETFRPEDQDLSY